MTDPVSPLDAYATAKPDEPTWTVQGGDPLGGPLLRVWAVFARVQAGVIVPGAVDNVFEQLLKGANNNVPDTDRGKDELLIRATQTEQVSWDMDAYLKGNLNREEEEEKLEQTLAELDLHDARVRAAQALSNYAGGITEIIEALEPLGFFAGGGNLKAKMLDLRLTLELTRDTIEPRRVMRRS